MKINSKLKTMLSPKKVKNTKPISLSEINNNQNSMEFAAYLWITLAVIIFNISSIGVDVIVLDDYAHYSEVVDGLLNTARFQRGIINPFFWYAFIKMLTYSPLLARLSLLILVMIPLSIIIYHICRKYLQLPYIVSLGSAILIQVLPNQVYIPTFIVGSYSTWALLIFCVAVLFCLRYLKSSQFRDLFGAILFYFLAVEATELSVFLIVPLFVLLLGFKKISKSHYILISFLIIIAVYKSIFVMLKPWADVTTPNFYDYKILFDRLINFIIWASPDPGINNRLLAPIWVVLICGGFIFYLIKPTHSLFDIRMKNEDVNYLSKRQRFTWFFLFGLTWFFVSFIPLGTAKYFSSRYAYIPAFGLNFLLMLGIYSFLQRGKLKKYHLPTFALIILLIMVGIERNKNIKRTFGFAEAVHSSVKNELSKFDFPKDSQIVISGPQIGYLFTGGYWNWSTGYLKYATKRNDIVGLVGKENNFYDPFNSKERGYSYTMKGLDLSKPLFLFRIKNDQYAQLTYCLQWEQEEKVDEWNIYHLNPYSGIMTLFKKGKGKLEYKDMLMATGIHPEEVYWGG